MAVELTPQQAMRQAVSTAAMRLADGALLDETLQYLWRAAFSAGVRAGQASPSQRSTSEIVDRLVRAEQDGWRYGTPWLYMGGMTRPGFRLAYGGVDQQGPNCDRPAVTLPVGSRGLQMQFDDTGERVRVPAVCWTREIREGRDGGDSAVGDGAV